MAKRGKKHKSRETLGQRHYSFWSARLYEGTSYVYVIRAGKNNPVKIGVAKKPLVRLKTLQTGNPQTLRLLLVVPGGERLEAALHHRFAEYRLDRSEWFYGDGVAQIIDFVTDLASEMVRSHAKGAHRPPPVAGFPGWTGAERRYLTEIPKPTIPMFEPVIGRLPRPEQIAAMEAAKNEPDYAPTIAQQIRRTRLRAPWRPSNLPGA